MADEPTNDPATEPEPDEPTSGPDPDPDNEPHGDEPDWKAEARKWEKRAKANSDAAARLKELEDAQKTEQQKLTERLTEAETKAKEAELRAARLEVATEKGLPKSSVKFLTGTTPEELEESADELLALLSTSSDDDRGRLPTKPRERLRGGGNPTEEPEETDPRKLAEGLPRF